MSLRVPTPRGVARRLVRYALGDVVVSPAPVPAPEPPPPEPQLPSTLWWEFNSCEPPLQLALYDYCCPGDTVFDVGANAGGVTIAMSRLVGPTGHVVAFEASPRIVGFTQRNLVAAGCGNATVVLKAVTTHSGRRVGLYAGGHLNDSLLGHGAPDFEVETLSLDDFCRQTGLWPSFVKMDIEGAEFDALSGMSELLSRQRPILALEQQPADARCRDFLASLHYIAVDLATYRRIYTDADFDEGVGVANLLFIPEERRLGDRFAQARAPSYFARLDRAQFNAADGGYAQVAPTLLPAGRYIVSADFSAGGGENEAMLELFVDDRLQVRYHATTGVIAGSNRALPFHLEAPAAVRLSLRMLKGADTGIDWRGADIWRAEAFDDWRKPVAG